MNLAERIAVITAETTVRIADSLTAAIEDTTTDEADIAFDLYKKRDEFADADDLRWHFMTAFEAGRHFGAIEERNGS